MNNYATNIINPKNEINKKENLLTALKSTKSKMAGITRTLFTICVFAVFVCLIADPGMTAKQVDRVLDVLYYSLIPATFPFIILSTLILKSGCGRSIGRLFPFLTKLFNISQEAVSIFIIGLISGFPIGGVCARELYDKSLADKDECERICAFCNICSPAFMISIFGKGIMNDAKAGVILYIVSCLFSVVYGIILGHSGKRTLTYQSKADTGKVKTPEKTGLSDMICDCVGSAGASCIRIYSFVIFFSLLTAVISEIVPLSGISTCLVSGFFEIASGLSMINGFESHIAFIIGSSVITFSGISVTMQIKSAMGTELSIKKYIIGRLAALLVCPAVSYFIYSRL